MHRTHLCSVKKKDIVRSEKGAATRYCVALRPRSSICWRACADPRRLGFGKVLERVNTGSRAGNIATKVSAMPSAGAAGRLQV